MKKDEYDWINDPFDEKKAAEEAQMRKSSPRTKALLGCGCLLVVVLIVALVVMGAVGAFSLMAE